MNLKTFGINVVLVIAFVIALCALVRKAAGEDVVPSSRSASYTQVLEVVGPPAGRDGRLRPGTTMFMLYQHPKEVREVWHWSKTRTKLSTHSASCFLEYELYTDGSMAYKILKP